MSLTSLFYSRLAGPAKERVQRRRRPGLASQLNVISHQGARLIRMVWPRSAKYACMPFPFVFLVAPLHSTTRYGMVVHHIGIDIKTGTITIGHYGKQNELTTGTSKLIGVLVTGMPALLTRNLVHEQRP